MPTDALTPDVAVAFIVGWLMRPKKQELSLLASSDYGHDLCLPNIISIYLVEVEGNTEQYAFNSNRGKIVSPAFYDAAWQLCRLGVLRPGTRDSQGQGGGTAGNGYSSTEIGRRWLISGGADVATLQMGKLAELFTRFRPRLGPGFVQRSVEAVTCHTMGAYLACCTMCGAGAESILLAVAIAKEKDEAKVLMAYKAASGRKRVTDMVVGGLKAGLASPFNSASALLSYWRDDAAHGMQSNISEIEAHEALGRLLRLAQFTTDNWDDLTDAT